MYTSFADYSFYGTPPVRVMNLEEGYKAEEKIKRGILDATANPYAMAVKKEIKDQFMMAIILWWLLYLPERKVGR